MEEDVCESLIFSSIAFNLSVISALPLIHSANAALHFVVWSIFPCLWIPLVKNADHADASFRSRSSSLSLVSQVSSSLAHGSSKLSPFTRELLPQSLWSCMKIFQTLINCPKIKFSDHKAAAGAVRRRRKRLVAAGGERHGVTQARSKPKGLATKPASAWSAFFSKGVQSRKKTSIIYPLDYYFYNTFNPLENIYSYCIRNKHTYQTSQKTEQSTPKS